MGGLAFPCEKEASGLEKRMTYEMDAVQGHSRDPLRKCVVKNTFESTHDAPEAVDASSQFL